MEILGVILTILYMWLIFALIGLVGALWTLAVRLSRYVKSITQN
jgi:hypothetical protein